MKLFLTAILIVAIIPTTAFSQVEGTPIFPEAFQTTLPDNSGGTCPYFELAFNNGYNNDEYGGSRSNQASVEVGDEAPSCITNLLNQAIQHAVTLYDWLDPSFAENTWEDLTADMGKFVSDSGRNIIEVFNAVAGTTMDRSTYAAVFFDENCRPLFYYHGEDNFGGVDGAFERDEDFRDRNGGAYVAVKPETLDACLTTFWYNSSPISLIWDSSTDIDSEFSVTAFPLNPWRSGEYYTWKASEAAPLLVFDPEHTGQITSALQLFGEWTFGGKQTAMAAGVMSDATALSATPWRDGYEALESFDSNFDGKISGEELKTLGLWFDKNRDGISQAGEVKPVIAAGVTELRFSARVKNSQTGDIYVEDGFTRVVDGAVRTGASVDWYGRGGASPQMLFRTFQPSEHSASANDDTSAQDESAKDTLSIPNLSGVWLWNMQGASDDKEGNTEGLLTLRESPDGTVSGMSVIESELKENERKLRSAVQQFKLSGRKIVERGGTIVFKFSVKDARGVATTSEAYVSKSGDFMRGTSSAAVKVDGKKSKLTYRWQATKKLALKTPDSLPVAEK